MKTRFIFTFILISCSIIAKSQPTIVSSSPSTSLICPGAQVSYSVSFPSGYIGCTYVWQVRSGSGTIVGSATQNSANFQWNDSNPNKVEAQVTIRYYASNGNCQSASESILTFTHILRSVYQQTLAGVSTPLNLTYCPQLVATLSVDRMFIANTGGFTPPVIPQTEVERYEWILPAGWRQTGTLASGTIYTTINSIEIEPSNPNGICSSSGQVKVRAYAGGASNCAGLPISGSNQSTIVLNLTPAFNLLPPSGYTGQTCNLVTPVTFTATALPCASSYSWSFPPAWSGLTSTTSNSVTLTPNGSSSTSGDIVVSANIPGCTVQKAYHVTYTNPTLALTGSGSVCQGIDQPFTITNLPSGTSVSWTATPSNLFVNSTGSSYPIVLRGANNQRGSANLSATAINAFCSLNQSMQLPFYVGTPAVTGQYRLSAVGSYGVSSVDLLPGTPYYFQIDQIPGALYYNWLLPDGFSFWNGSSGNNITELITTAPAEGYYDLGCAAVNACGNGGALGLTVHLTSSGGGGVILLVSPNVTVR